MYPVMYQKTLTRLSNSSLVNKSVFCEAFKKAIMLLTIAFPGTKIWLTHILSSLCQKPKLMPYLREILHSSSITKQHENYLEKMRMLDANPRERLIKGLNIWNLSVIDR